MQFEYEGKKYEFRGEYRKPKQDESFLADNGSVFTCRTNEWAGVRAIVHPVPKRHTFGGVVFEETGERRPPGKGEWAFNKVAGSVFCVVEGDFKYNIITCPILRPVGLAN